MNMENNNRKNNRAAYQGMHLLGQGRAMCSDTWQTGINNNVLLFGPSGAGKTRGYVKPNILNATESMIISDTKGSLYHEVGDYLKEKGYKVYFLNFANFESNCRYNPLSFIRFDEAGRPLDQDIKSISRVIVPEDHGTSDPYWNNSARQYLDLLICYALEFLPEEQHTLTYVSKLGAMMHGKKFHALMDDVMLLSPESSVARIYAGIKDTVTAEKMYASTVGILNTYISELDFKEAGALYNHEVNVDFADFGREKVAMFITVSDTDRSKDVLANLYMTQAIQALCASADRDYENHMLPVPVRLYLDDFATNLYIPDFDKTISVIRSREIYVSIILQSLTQLDALYGHAKAMTILNNCDQQLYLGGQDISTAEYIAARVDKTKGTILSMPLDKAYLLIRGRKPELIDKLS